ncbi:MAG: PorP/SprF family type IX secretion system membrane protein [Bacteroidota bacterium]
MKIKFLIFSIALLFTTYKIQAQDPIFTQYYLIPETLNPGFSGSSEAPYVGVLQRIQWPSLDLKVQTSYAFGSFWIEEANSGIGFNAIRQTESFNDYRLQQFNVNYAYRVQLSDEWFFRPGIEIGWGFKDFNFQNLLLEDQININSGVNSPTSIDPLTPNTTVNYVDISAGMVFNTRNSWIGFSLKHINRPNISLRDERNEPLEMLLSVNTGYEIKLLDMVDIAFLPNEAKLIVTGNYMRQGRFDRLDMGTIFDFERFLAGATFSMDVFDRTPNSHVLTSINPFFGVRITDDMRFGVSYDINTSSIGRTNGVYEFSLTYRFTSRYEDCYGCPTYIK